MRSFSSVLLFVSLSYCYGLFPACYAQMNVRNRLHIDIAPFASVRSPTIEMMAGQALRLSSEKSSDLSLDAYVYSADDDLVGKSDNEATESYYEWNAIRSGTYYVVVHNVTGFSGSATITLQPSHITKSLSATVPNSIVREVY